MDGLSRVLLVTGAPDRWKDLVDHLREEGLAWEVVGVRGDPAEVAAAARSADRVVVVDLAPDFSRGLDVVSTCRKSAPATPVVAVAENPSVELARNIRTSGVFYLAVHPVTVDEMRTVLEDALRSIGRKQCSASACKTRKRVLVVDDDPDYCASVTALLEGEGYTVRCAASAREGLERVDADRPDLIILDIMMEDAWAGYGLNQALKYGTKQAVAGTVPILMVSSIGQPPEAIFPTAGEAAMVTPDAYLTKPLDIPVFLEQVRRLLGLAERVGSSP